MKGGSTQSHNYTCMLLCFNLLPKYHETAINIILGQYQNPTLQLILTAKITLRFNFQEANFQSFKNGGIFHRPLHIGQWHTFYDTGV